MSTRDGEALDRTTLLEQVSWIRRLARELVSDRHLADDLTQETCAVALEKQPAAPGNLRAWLAGVLRQALRGHARSRARRMAREREAARGEAIESTERLVERLALQRELVGIVEELEDPYRSTVLLRFFEELPPREIARRSGVPVGTVNSRLQRALARLRPWSSRRDLAHACAEADPVLSASRARAGRPRSTSVAGGSRTWGGRSRREPERARVDRAPGRSLEAVGNAFGLASNASQPISAANSRRPRRSSRSELRESSGRR